MSYTARLDLVIASVVKRVPDDKATYTITAFTHALFPPG